MTKSAFTTNKREGLEFKPQSDHFNAKQPTICFYWN